MKSGMWLAIAIAALAWGTGCSSGSLDGISGGGGQGGAGGQSAGPVDIGGDGERESFVVGAPSNAIACTLGSECATGNCVDGFCCDNKCDNKCMACSAAKKGSGVDGICGSIKYDTDPDNDCPVGACDGKNMCKNYNGVACTASPQCLSNYCVDGYCCGNICMGACQACSAAKKGSGYNGVCGSIAANTDPDNECNPGECNGSTGCNSAQTPAANGTSCTSGAQCSSGYCADGVCCDNWCLGTCQACTAAKKGSGVNGVCGPIANDQDPDEECWGGACNGASVCKQYNGVPCTDKSQCLSNYCVDGFCCGNICSGMCYACSEARKGQGYDGVCGPIASGKDPDNECNPGECGGSGTCNQAQTPQVNGTLCVSGGQCASANCVDGVCCDTACASTCMACTAAKKGSGVDGTCGLIGSEQDPDVECNGGKCDGKGVCRFYNGAPCSTTGQCFSTYCVDGYCCGNVCTGACQACSNAKKGSGYDGVCGNVANGTDPENECNPGECNGSGACNQPQAQQPNGVACTQATQCASGFCVDGVCCDGSCPLSCEACTAAKKGQGINGTCGNIVTGTDPDNECMNSDCNGSGGCTTPANLPNGSTCTASTQCASMNCIDGFCCDTACNGICVACSAAKKGQGTNGVCGVIKYDTDPDEECYAGACNGSGFCQYYNSAPCSVNTQCLSTYCVDGFCCNNHCGGTCYACSAAKKGSGSDGVCSFIANMTDPDAECSGSYCTGSGTCKANTCATNAECPSTATCTVGQCVCSAGYTGSGIVCTDINECLTNNGGCNVYATCTNMPGSRLCECNAGFTGDGFTCTDIDECLTNNGGCDVHATCTNTPGTRTCACNMGYVGDGFTCTYSGAFTLLESGWSSTCAQVADGRVKCWGANSYGTLGIGDTLSRGFQPMQMGSNLPVLNLGTGKTVVQLSVGYRHACAVLNDATVKCWGNNFFGQLGLGDGAHRGDGPNEMGDNLPTVNLGTGKTAVQVSAGRYHTCALLNDGSVKCWGDPSQGQIGLGDIQLRGDQANEMGDNLPAVNLGTGKTAVAIEAGITTTCAILNDGGLKCWGGNENGNLGLGDTVVRGDSPGEMGDNLPTVQLGTGKTAVAITSHMTHMCAILNDAHVKCWGKGGILGLGDNVARGDNPGEMGDNLPAVDLGTGRTAVAIGVGLSHTCAILDDGNVKCWGYGVEGELGSGDTWPRGEAPNQMGNNLPVVDLGTGKTALRLSVGEYFACVVTTGNVVKCWGYNVHGQLGLGDTFPRGDQPGEMGDNLPAVSIF